MSKETRHETEQKTATEVAELASVLTLSSKKTEAAKLAKIGRTTLYRKLNKYPQVGAIVLDKKKEAYAILENAAPDAAKTMVGELGSNRNKMDASKEILDRVGITRQGGQTNTNVQVNFGDFVKNV